MIWLVLAVGCSLGIAALFKLAERRNLDRTALLTVNYAAGAVLAAVLQGVGRAQHLDGGLVALGVAQGVLFIGGFWLFSLAIRRAGMGLAAGVMRLSVVVPVVAAAVVWGEAVTPAQMAGLVLAGAAFFLVSRPPAALPGVPDDAADDDAPDAARGGTLGLLVLLFLAGGLVDVLNKTFAETYAGRVPESLFLLFVFGVAFAVGAAVVVATGVRTGRWPGRAVVGWGVVLGLINYGSADFFLRAIAWAAGRAAFVFPANSVSIVVGAALIGRFVWGERLSRANVAGLVVAAVALVLLAR